MAQLFTSVVFTLIAVGAIALVVGMLKRDWMRVATILSEGELMTAPTSAPEMRVRLRSWNQAELRQAPSLRHAAA